MGNKFAMSVGTMESTDWFVLNVTAMIIRWISSYVTKNSFH